MLETYKILTNDDDNKKLEKIRVLGWCVELLQAYFLLLDDIMDDSITRRGKTCWYKKVHVKT